jgi:hypothetical protein
MPEVFSGILAVSNGRGGSLAGPNGPIAPGGKLRVFIRAALIGARKEVFGSAQRAKSPLGRFREVAVTRMNTGWNRGLRVKKNKIKRLFFAKTKRGGC